MPTYLNYDTVPGFSPMWLTSTAHGYQSKQAMDCGASSAWPTARSPVGQNAVMAHSIRRSRRQVRQLRRDPKLRRYPVG